MTIEAIPITVKMKKKFLKFPALVLLNFTVGTSFLAIMSLS